MARKVSTYTALRDIRALIEPGLLIKNVAGGGSTRYALAGAPPESGKECAKLPFESFDHGAHSAHDSLEPVQPPPSPDYRRSGWNRRKRRWTECREV